MEHRDVFKWIKQHLHITRFYGTSANAVCIQIYVAVTAYCLVLLAKSLYGFEGTAYEMFRIISVSLFERQPLGDIIERYKNIQPQKTHVLAIII